MREMSGDDARVATTQALRDAVGRDGLGGTIGPLLAEGAQWAGTGPGGACRSRSDVLGVLESQVEMGLQPRLRTVRPAGDRVLVEIALSPEGDGDLVVWMVLTLDESGEVRELHGYPSEGAAAHDLALLGTGATRTPPTALVEGLAPFVHVSDIVASVAFYGLLGFVVGDTYEEDGELRWAALSVGGSTFMLAQADDVVDPNADTIFFYLYASDLVGLRDHLVAHGATVGPIVDGTPGPRRQMRVTDPDGFCLMVASPDP